MDFLFLSLGIRAITIDCERAIFFKKQGFYVPLSLTIRFCRCILFAYGFSVVFPLHILYGRLESDVLVFYLFHLDFLEVLDYDFSIV